MIRIRHTDGQVTDIPTEGVFVELLNDVDKSVGVVFTQPRPGVVVMIRPGSRDAQNYERMFAKAGVRFSDQMIHRTPEVVRG